MLAHGDAHPAVASERERNDGVTAFMCGRATDDVRRKRFKWGQRVGDVADLDGPVRRPGFPPGLAREFFQVRRTPILQVRGRLPQLADRERPPQVEMQNLRPLVGIRKIDPDMVLDPAASQKRPVDDFGMVRSRDDHDAMSSFDAIYALQ